jgi:hypothetical protein
MADSILEWSLKTRYNTMCCDILCYKFKKIDKFQLCLKTAASLFPFSFITYLILNFFKFWHNISKTEAGLLNQGLY